MARKIAMDNYFQRRSYRKRYAIFYARNAITSHKVTDFEGQREKLAQVFEKMSGPKYMAQTSGTTREPKLVPYDLKRTRYVQKAFFRSMITLTRDIPGHKTFFVFASLRKDQSLTAGMVEENKNPSYLELLQAPYRYLHTTEGQALIEKVGELTARIMVMVVTQPRFLYATNPSTITYFLKELELRWKEVRVRLKSVPPGLQRLGDAQGERLMMTFLIRDKAPRLQELLPELKALITWDGGYVKPFLDQLKDALPGIQFLPMYSMSTETIETLPHRIDGKIYYLPVAKGTYPEFNEPDTEKLLSPFDLVKGKTYELIATDEWGLRRYATRDLFLVKDIVGGIPDLAFVKRKGMTSSLTGEKLTEDHVQSLADFITQRFPELGKFSVSLYPVQTNDQIGYELAVITRSRLPYELEEIAAFELSRINTEYASKVSSKRLAPLKVVAMSEQKLAEMMGKQAHWESQFKVLPLYEKLIVR